MSEVLKRKQGISEMEFYRNADNLRTELSAFLMREKVVPSKWRHLITDRALDHIEDMMEYMHDANDIFPFDPDELKERKRLQQCCISCCHKIGEVMQNAIRNVWWETLHATNDKGEPTVKRLNLEFHLSEISRMLEFEETLLNGWKKSSRLMKKH